MRVVFIRKGFDSSAGGQEFVCDIRDHAEPRRWLAETIAAIGG